MKRLSLVLALVFLAQPTLPVWANTLPPEIGYTIYRKGVEIGRCDIKVAETVDELVFESTTKVDLGNDMTLEMTCRTVADPKTFLIRSYEYVGQKAGVSLDGFLEIDGDSLHGVVLRDDVESSDYKLSPYDRNLLLEDFVMDHEVLIALAHSVSGENPGTYGLMFPTGMSFVKATLAFASTLEIESDYKSTVCKKLLVAIEGSQPFASFYDPNRRLPVYMAFPQTHVEVFLDEFFGDSPVSRYRE
jgi:hypothetical protein